MPLTSQTFDREDRFADIHAIENWIPPQSVRTERYWAHVFSGEAVLSSLPLDAAEMYDIGASAQVTGNSSAARAAFEAGLRQVVRLRRAETKIERQTTSHPSTRLLLQIKTSLAELKYQEAMHLPKGPRKRDLMRQVGNMLGQSNDSVLMKPGFARYAPARVLYARYLLYRKNPAGALELLSRGADHPGLLNHAIVEVPQARLLTAQIVEALGGHSRAAEILSLGGHGKTIRPDMADMPDAQALFERVKAHRLPRRISGAAAVSVQAAINKTRLAGGAIALILSGAMVRSASATQQWTIAAAASEPRAFSTGEITLALIFVVLTQAVFILWPVMLTMQDGRYLWHFWIPDSLGQHPTKDETALYLAAREYESLHRNRGRAGAADDMARRADLAARYPALAGESWLIVKNYRREFAAHIHPFHAMIVRWFSANRHSGLGRARVISAYARFSLAVSTVAVAAAAAFLWAAAEKELLWFGLPPGVLWLWALIAQIRIHNGLRQGRYHL